MSQNKKKIIKNNPGKKKYIIFIVTTQKSLVQSISDMNCTKLLGVSIYDKLSFSQHLEFLVTKSNSRLFL